MRKILTLIFNVICIFLLSICAFAESEIEIYNRGEKVELNHGLIYENGQYYIHIDDLSLLDLEVSDESDFMTVITSNDCLGVEGKLEIEKKRSFRSCDYKTAYAGTFQTDIYGQIRFGIQLIIITLI